MAKESQDHQVNIVIPSRSPSMSPTKLQQMEDIKQQEIAHLRKELEIKARELETANKNTDAAKANCT